MTEHVVPGCAWCGLGIQLILRIGLPFWLRLAQLMRIITSPIVCAGL